ncbi:unnamed protein product [Darwinula stevensoni]|uniref:Uncharacterized protein n=1 Tax=Darwinula stevensoni TaxID=69355 RepID=A0A7R8XED1_9CRUS|nr:unnamed protein product [Darwinula stevensoni]CAG0895674.1 unnamed protein product [Darwinula stevensoni]
MGSMRVFWLYLLSLAYWESDQACPTQVILPCICFNDYDEEVSVDCSNATTSAEIWRAFNGDSWPSSPLSRFILLHNKAVMELPNRMFGNLAFQKIELYSTILESVHPSVILSSKDWLVTLKIGFSRLKEFPFYLLPWLPHLRELHLLGNHLTKVPTLRSPSLQLLYLQLNEISGMEEGEWTTPELRIFLMDSNPIVKLPASVMKSLQSLETFQCGGCHLGPNLPPGALAFRSKTLRKVMLSCNNISRLDPGAITGLGYNTTVILDYNNIEVMAEESFRPVLEILSLLDGFLSLTGTAKDGTVCRETGDYCCELASTAKTSGSTTGEETNGEVKENGETNEEVCLCPDTDGYSCVETNVAVCDPGSVIHFACPKYTQLQSTINGQLFLFQSMGFPSSQDKEELERRIRGNVLKEAKRGSAGFSVEIRS